MTEEECECCGSRNKGRARMAKLSADLVTVLVEARTNGWYEDDEGWDEADLILRKMGYDIQNSRLDRKLGSNPRP